MMQIEICYLAVRLSSFLVGNSSLLAFLFSLVALLFSDVAADSWVFLVLPSVVEPLLDLNRLPL